LCGKFKNIFHLRVKPQVKNECRFGIGKLCV